jgi:hypothetical protein
MAECKNLVHSPDTNPTDMPSSLANDWIPVNIERPRDQQQVLAAYDEPFFGQFEKNIDRAIYQSDDATFWNPLSDKSIMHVTHWKALPEFSEKRPSKEGACQSPEPPVMIAEVKRWLDDYIKENGCNRITITHLGSLYSYMGDKILRLKDENSSLVSQNQHLVAKLEKEHKVLSALQKEFKALQSRLSSMKAEREKWESAWEEATAGIGEINQENYELTRDRDLYKKESEAHRKAWNDATALLEAKNLENAEIWGALQEAYKWASEMKYPGAMPLVEKVIAKYKKEEQK